MFKKRSKKALSHVDWAMSLAIFLLYLAWFFIFVKPLFSPSSSMDVLLDILEDGVENNLYQDISRIKVFVPEDINNEHEIITIPFDYDWELSDIAHSADHFVIDSNKMFFIANLSKTDMFSIYYPLDALTQTPLMRVIADENQVTYDTFTADFDEYLVDSVRFRDDERILAVTVEVDESVIDDEGSFENSTLLAKYTREDNSINLTSYVFSQNSRIDSYITPADFRNHSVTIDFIVYNYTDYYVDHMSNGELTYRILPQCKYYESDFLDLYDSGSGLLFTFDREITFRLCTNDTAAMVRMEFDTYVGEEDNFNIILHDGDVNDVLDYPVKPIVGVTETINTVSAKQVSLFKNRDYDYQKQKLLYPRVRDFNITVYSDVVDASYGAEQPAVADIYARKIEGVIIDENYEPNRALITLNVW